MIATIDGETFKGSTWDVAGFIVYKQHLKDKNIITKAELAEMVTCEPIDVKELEEN